MYGAEVARRKYGGYDGMYYTLCIVLRRRFGVLAGRGSKRQSRAALRLRSLLPLTLLASCLLSCGHADRDRRKLPPPSYLGRSSIIHRPPSSFSTSLTSSSLTSTSPADGHRDAVQGDSAMEKPRCYLLELPAELRVQIYNELVLPTTVRIGTMHEPIVADMRELFVTTTCFYFRQYYTEKLHPSILRACRQIYQEAEPLLYQPSIVQLQLCDGVSKVTPFEVRKLHSIRHLEELHITLKTVPATKNLDVNLAKLLSKHINPNLSVGRLVVDLPNHYMNDIFHAMMRMAHYFFKAAKSAQTTTVHLRSEPCGRASWQKERNGEFRDCTVELNSEMDNHGYNCKSPNIHLICWRR